MTTLLNIVEAVTERDPELLKQKPWLSRACQNH